MVKATETARVIATDSTEIQLPGRRQEKRTAGRKQ
jgi:hypothetical protein